MKNTEGSKAVNDRNHNGETICHCAGCDWCKSLEDSMGRTIYFCMNAESSAYLEETGLCGNCTISAEDAPGGW